MLKKDIEMAFDERPNGGDMFSVCAFQWGAQSMPTEQQEVQVQCDGAHWNHSTRRIRNSRLALGTE